LVATVVLAQVEGFDTERDRVEKFRPAFDSGFSFEPFDIADFGNAFDGLGLDHYRSVR
jgi:hypothetical protein